jgi:hypothetical protein
MGMAQKGTACARRAQRSAKRFQDSQHSGEILSDE